MKKRFSEEQILGFLREADANMATKELCRKQGFSEASYYLLRSKFVAWRCPKRGGRRTALQRSARLAACGPPR